MLKFIVAIAETLLETSTKSHHEIVRAVESARKILVEHTGAPINPKSSLVRQAVDALSMRLI